MTKKTKKTDDFQPQSSDPELETAPAAGAEDISEAQAETETVAEEKTEGVVEAELEAEVEAELETEVEAYEELDAVEAEIEAEADGAAEDALGGAEAEDGPESESRSKEDESEFNPKPRPPAKLERLQKILAQAGVSSRRKAEELIEQGRVQVNGKTVTELGTKADAGRDHIRVDGKLLQGAERLRYFVLNKPKGFVTTVKDPEGRPTVMQFFDKMRERLYPVGRLDYMSEGLLLVTNDGELANRLTRASAGVEKTYLVKVAGQPTEDELDQLRSGVAIERGKPGSERVRTSPARIRQVRQGDNPWYEVVLIEGRNRELRKMFEEIGHFVEKIRRVGYGPLVLDQEPGNLRELDAQELELLRKAADGTLRTPKSKEVRRRNAADASQLPTVTPRGAGSRPAKSFGAKSFEERPALGPKDYRPKRSFGEGSDQDRSSRPARPARSYESPRSADTSRSGAGGPAKFGSSRPTARPFSRPSARPAWQKDDRASSRPPTQLDAGSTLDSKPASRPSTGKPYAERPAAGRSYGSKPPASRTYGAKPSAGGGYRDKRAAGKPFAARPAATRTYGAKPALNKPAWKKPEAADRPYSKRPPAPRRDDEDEVVNPVANLGPKTPSRLRIEAIEQQDRSSEARTSETRPSRPSAPRSRPDRPTPDRSGPARSSSAKPFRGEGGLSRPFTTSSGKPRAGGARSNNKPGKSTGYQRSGSGRPLGAAGSSRPYTPRAEGASESRPRSSKPYSGSAPRTERKAGSGWKPKPSFGGPGKPASSSVRSKPGSSKSGSSKSGYKGKSTGPKRTGAPGGRKRS
jgi:23S rRNA pseudouridine2605 synthase